jgi:hypothetical protein
MSGHPLLSIGLVVVLAAAAVWLGSRRAWLRALTAVCATLAVLGCVVVGHLAGAGWEVTETVQSTEGPDRRIVVRSGSAVIDPLWWVTVEQGHGLTAREWDVGHFNGDAGDFALTGVAWTGPHRLRMTTGSGEHITVDLDPETGESGAPVSRG